MKYAQELSFPLIIKWHGDDKYLVEKDGDSYDWTLLRDKRGMKYYDSVKPSEILDSIERNEATILWQSGEVKKPLSVSSLTVDVDCSKIREALALVKELEEGYTRLMALMR